jgi:hypothetical protein
MIHTTNGKANVAYASTTLSRVVARPSLLNSTYIGTRTAIGGSMRITSKAKKRNDRPVNGKRANAYAAGTPTQSDNVTALPATTSVLTNANRKSDRLRTST